MKRKKTKKKTKKKIITKRIAKFDGLEPRRWEAIKEIVAAEIGPKTFGTFEKQAADVDFTRTLTGESLGPQPDYFMCHRDYLTIIVL